MIVYVEDIGDGTSQWQYLNKKSTDDLSINDTWEAIALATGDVGEAPLDGLPYVRQNGTWAEAGGGAFIPLSGTEEVLLRVITEIRLILIDTMIVLYFIREDANNKL